MHNTHTSRHVLQPTEGATASAFVGSNHHVAGKDMCVGFFGCRFLRRKKKKASNRNLSVCVQVCVRVSESVECGTRKGIMKSAMHSVCNARLRCVESLAHNRNIDNDDERDESGEQKTIPYEKYMGSTLQRWCVFSGIKDRR
jgi:hypothetical protein